MLEQFLERIEAQDKGTPISIGNERIEDGGAYIKVRRIGTPQYEKEISELRATKMSMFSPQDDQDSLDLITSWLSEFGVTGWYGISDPLTGNALDFSRKHCRQIFKNPQYIGLVNILVTEANRLENFLDITLKDIEEDLKKPLSEM